MSHFSGLAVAESVFEEAGIMWRSISFIAVCIAVLLAAGSSSWSQVIEGDSPGNPVAVPGGSASPTTSNRTLTGTPDNPNLDATDVNPLDARARDTDIATDPVNDPQPVGTVQPTMESVRETQRVARSNDWRLVFHNGVWWYWTPYETWLYYRNRQWHAYIPGDIRRQQARESGLSGRRYGVGYRGSAAYDDDVAIETYRYEEQSQYQPRGGIGIGTNYGGTTFFQQHPVLPTEVELQRFQQMQQTTITPFGGTSGGVQDPNLSGSNPVVGGNPIRGGVAAPGGAFSTGGVGTSATGGGTASPNPSTGTSPSSTTTPGNPAAGSTPAGGTGGAGTSGGATSSGAASGGTGS